MNVCDRTRTVKIREEVYEVPCGSRYCPACGARWMGDQRVQAVAASEEIPTDVALITPTAPGDAVRDRIMRQRGWSRKEFWSWWNGTAAERWRGLHLEASSVARRQCVAAGHDWRVHMRVWEYQKRGAKHVHVVCPMGSEPQRRATMLYVRRLSQAAAWWGFGMVLGGKKRRHERPGRVPRVARVPAGAAARYVAKYVAATGAGKDGLVTTVQRIAQRGSVLYISPRLTRASGVNMAKLRNRRRIWSRYRWARPTTRAWRAGCLVDAVQRGRAPLEREAVLALRRLSLRHDVRRVVDTATGEVVALTPAPRPLKADDSAAPRVGPGRLAAVALASVLVRDSQAPWLGPTRTRLVAAEVVAG